MKDLNENIIILLLFILPMGFTTPKQSIYSDLNVKELCLLQIEQPTKIISNNNKQNKPPFKTKKNAHNSQDTNEILKSLKHDINTIDLLNIRTIYNRQNAIDSVKQYLPKVFLSETGNIRNLEGLIALVRLAPVWEYLDYKYKTPKEISITFWIHETGYGNSVLFREHKNFGGVKYYKNHKSSLEAYPVWQFDDCYNKKGVKIKCAFRGYHNLSTSIDSWGRVLALARYTNHYTENDSYKKKVNAYHNHGYWSSKDGNKKRINTIEKYNLHEI